MRKSPLIGGLRREDRLCARLDRGTEFELAARCADSGGCEILHEDRGLSGAAAQPPGLADALGELGRGDVLLVWKLDRLGRPLPHLSHLVEGLGKAGAGSARSPNRAGEANLSRHGRAGGVRALPDRRANTGGHTGGAALRSGDREPQEIMQPCGLNTARCSSPVIIRSRAPARQNGPLSPRYAAIQGVQLIMSSRVPSTRPHPADFRWSARPTWLRISWATPSRRIVAGWSPSMTDLRLVHSSLDQPLFGWRFKASLGRQLALRRSGSSSLHVRI